MSPSITIISIPLDDPDSFAEIFLDQRKNNSGGWATFELRSERYVHSFLMRATGADLGVTKGEDRDDHGMTVETRMIDRKTLVRVISDLEQLVEKKTAATAHALFEHEGSAGSRARIETALTSETWPTSGDAAEEAAAFAFQLLRYGRKAKTDGNGVCWEYRGELSP